MRSVVTAALIMMLVIFAVYATCMTTELGKQTTYIGELKVESDILTDTVCKQAEAIEQAKANQQRMVSGWHVREMELIQKIGILETAGSTGVHDLEGIRDELRAVQADLTVMGKLDETLKLIAHAHDRLQVVFMADVSIQPTDPIHILPADDPLMLGCPTQSAQLYESGDWSYVLIVEDIGTDKACVTGWLMKGNTPQEPFAEPVDPNISTSLETPWGIMYWRGEDRESGFIGWHKQPKDSTDCIDEDEDIDLDGLWTPVDDPTVEVE